MECPIRQTIVDGGADPPKNVSGSTGTHSSVDARWMSVKSGYSSFITEPSFRNTEPFMKVIQISEVRSRCSSAVMIFSIPSSSAIQERMQIILIGKGGQISSNVLVGVLAVQTTRRSRRRGDSKTMCRHLRHTCVNVSHVHDRRPKSLDVGSHL